MEQPSFNFGRAPNVRRIETPISRANDPVSSHLAAEQITQTGKRQSHLELIVAAVYAHPGCTAGELTQYTGLTHVQIDRRTGDLRMSERIVFGAIRQCRVIGSQQQTLWPMQAERLVA
ncbi:hypothetical protein [Dyella caseinilytica]|uniref:Uncharacterized protein n=1 Tax=Dyella caseinilytica TaxID=1849581 RepID=A0ABX7GY26_9GAMM|nr:hypothetical protein [Dyella caseinilytica]QRN55230.1 hypothetical protein ISN74_07845 [Dyella caseinilytica]GGA00273.1 hypothetical protein GCM10011408_21470 [Dyella caseinilytica]